LTSRETYPALAAFADFVGLGPSSVEARAALNEIDTWRESFELLYITATGDELDDL